jgi:hypothetical protein
MRSSRAITGRTVTHVYQVIQKEKEKSSRQHKIAAGTKILPIQNNTAEERHFFYKNKEKNKKQKKIV